MTIIEFKKVKNTMLSKMSSKPREMDFTIKTKPFEWKVTRNLQDLKILRKRLSVMHPDTIVPPIPDEIAPNKHFP